MCSRVRNRQHPRYEPLRISAPFFAIKQLPRNSGKDHPGKLQYPPKTMTLLELYRPADVGAPYSLFFGLPQNRLVLGRPLGEMHQWTVGERCSERGEFVDRRVPARIGRRPDHQIPGGQAPQRFGQGLVADPGDALQEKAAPGRPGAQSGQDDRIPGVVDEFHRGSDVAVRHEGHAVTVHGRTLTTQSLPTRRSRLPKVLAIPHETKGKHVQIGILGNGNLAVALGKAWAAAGT